MDLFGNPSAPLPVKGKPKTIELLYLLYGKIEGEKCKNCQHLSVKRRGHNYYKCDLRKLTNGPSSDHRVGYTACGKFIKTI